MKVKKRWTDLDFEEMGWHDVRIYSILFPDDQLELILDIDYIFEWVELSEGGYKFWVSKCNLKFQNVLYLKVSLDFSNSVGVDIITIDRKLVTKGHMSTWNYVVETDKGNITFESSGFIQEVITDPILSNSLDLENRSEL